MALIALIATLTIKRMQEFNQAHIPWSNQCFDKKMLNRQIGVGFLGLIKSLIYTKELAMPIPRHNIDNMGLLHAHGA